MAGNHPGNAAYVSADGKVSFDRYGRKLDSIGNVVAGDRQRAGDAGASPIQRREEQPKGPPAQNPAAQYTFPTNATGLPVARSGWDKSVIPAPGAAGAPGGRMGNNPNVLAPGGIDPATGRPYPTTMNGGLQVPAQGSGKAWRQPWMGAQPTTSGPPPISGARYTFPAGAQARSAASNIPMQTGGLDVPMTIANADRVPPQAPGYDGPLQFEPYNPGMYMMVAPDQRPIFGDPVGQQDYNRPLGIPTPVDPVGPQNYGRNLDVAQYVGGYTGPDPVGYQNYDRNLDVSAYMPGGAQYKSWR